MAQSTGINRLSVFAGIVLDALATLWLLAQSTGRIDWPRLEVRFPVFLAALFAVGWGAVQLVGWVIDGFRAPTRR